METKQTRIFLWTCSRSLSTAFYRAINNAPGTLGILEPYFAINKYGEDLQKDNTSTSERSGSAYLDIKAKLDQPYTGHTTVFVKALAFRLLAAPYKIEELLPEGYVHTFLIRNPRKCVTSMYKMFLKEESSGWTNFGTRAGETKELYELYTFLTNNLGINCLVVDADDLEEHPESVLTAYCDFVGIKFHPSMVHWNLAESSKFEEFKNVTNTFGGSYFETVTNTTTFIKPENQLEMDLSKYPPIVKETVDELMPYYEELYKNRLVIR